MTFLQRRKGYDLQTDVPGVHRLRGQRASTSRRSASAVGRIVTRHNGLCIGSGPGELYDQKKFDTPYIRDFLLDRGILADVSETAAPWSGLRSVHADAAAAARGAFARLRLRGYVMCHLSHSYHSGACLYFTFALVPTAAQVPIDAYDEVKSAIQQAFVDAGATLSHHHAVGTEHARWLEQDISAPGVTMLRALFDGVDPGANLNPGKITGLAAADVERNHDGVHLEGPSRRVVAEPVTRPETTAPAEPAAAAAHAAAAARTTAVSAAALVPGPLYGLRTWSAVGGRGEERLEGPLQHAPWPPGGAFLAAACAVRPEHAAPAPGCTCGIHALHPRRAGARQVLAARGRIAGVVEAGGTIEVHRDGFRAERARPHAFFVTPRANAALVGRLAVAYRAEVVEVSGRGRRSSPGAASTSSGSRRRSSTSSSARRASRRSGARGGGAGSGSPGPGLRSRPCSSSGWSSPPTRGTGRCSGGRGRSRARPESVAGLGGRGRPASLDGQRRLRGAAGQWRQRRNGQPTGGASDLDVTEASQRRKGRRRAPASDLDAGLRPAPLPGRG